MAGMDWLRWHHGSVTDPKFQLIAKKSSCSVAEVIAFWAFVLESASMASDRGDVANLDVESIECLLGLDDGKGALIYEAMKVREIISDEGRVVSWNKRQPKRERDDDSSQERTAEYRNRQKEAEATTHAQTDACDALENHVTPSDANNEQVSPSDALDKSRQEKNKNNTNALPRFDFFKALTDAEVSPDMAKDWITLRKAKRLAQTATAFRLFETEASKSGLSVREAVTHCCRKGWGGLEAAWIKPADLLELRPSEDPNEIITLPNGQKMTRAQQQWTLRMVS